MLGDYPLFDSFCAAVFMVGTFVFTLGLINNLYVWTKGSGQGLGQSIKEGAGTIFSRRIGQVLYACFESVFHPRLFREDLSRGLAMVTIIIAYVGIILVNHIKAAGMPELEKISSFALFFYSPFCDIYFLRTVTEASFDTTQAVYALLNDGFGFLILVIGEGILIWRRFIKKVHIFRMKWVDIFIVAALGGWFALRFLAEAVTILAFNVPDSIAAYWFVAYGISKVIGPLGFHWPDFYIITWSLSGIALAVLFASIPYHRKLWHIISAPLSMVINALSEEKHVFSKPEDKSAFTTRQLIEIDACVQCGICAEHCVTYQQHQNEHIVPGEVIAAYGQRLRQKHGLFSSLIDRDPPDKLDEEAFGKAL
jgi:hypothetical protein